jgi:hypothetical protein
MKFREIIVEHPDGSWEIKETIKVKTLGFESILTAGKKLNSHLFSAIYGSQLNELHEKELSKHPELDIWELHI